MFDSLRRPARAGLIVVTTTNMAPLSDPAFFRPGRVDVMIAMHQLDAVSSCQLLEFHLEAANTVSSDDQRQKMHDAVAQG